MRKNSQLHQSNLSAFGKPQKLRDTSAQSKPEPRQEPVIIQNKSQLIYGSERFKFIKPVKVNSTSSHYQDIGLQIRDFEQTQDSQQWNEILVKTKALEENLLQLKSSINKNLHKLQKYKPNNINSNNLNGLQNAKSQSDAERLSKESTQSYVSAQSKKSPVLQQSTGMSHNPSLTSLMLTSDRQRKELHLNTETVVKVQALSRIHSPFQNKELSRQAFSRSTANFKQHLIDMMYLPTSPLKDRLITGQFIGRGKFSDVYLAKDAFTGFVFALKSIRKDIIREYQMEDQLSKEIKIQSMMDHPNIVKLYGTFYDEDKVYLVLEFCGDGELFQHQHRQKSRKFEEIVAAQMIDQILNAIKYMHDHHVMHRDLKTENILISHGQIKLCDLGCVCEEGPPRTTFCGTVDYIAPEVITGGASEPDSTMKGYDQRCDNWQVGVLAYELVVGQTPFTDRGPRDEDKIMSNILNREVSFPDTTSSELKSFVKAALQKDPEKRSSITRMMMHPWVVKGRQAQIRDINSVL